MIRRLKCLLFVAILMFPCIVGAVTAEDFEVRTTQDLIDLCTAPPDHLLHAAAVHFCVGYLVGAYDYHEAASTGPDGRRLVCMPDPEPSRNEAILMFLDWAKRHPQYMDEPPVETEFRFLMEKWPCK